VKEHYVRGAGCASKIEIRRRRGAFWSASWRGEPIGRQSRIFQSLLAWRSTLRHFPNYTRQGLAHLAVYMD